MQFCFCAWTVCFKKNKTKKAFLIFFVNARVYSWVTALVDLSLFYIVQNTFIVATSQDEILCLETSSEMCVTDLLAVVIFCFRMLWVEGEKTQLVPSFPIFVALTTQIRFQIKSQKKMLKIVISCPPQHKSLPIESQYTRLQM